MCTFIVSPIFGDGTRLRLVETHAFYDLLQLIIQLGSGGDEGKLRGMVA